MKFSIKLQDVLHAYIDQPNRRYICLLIQDDILKNDDLELQTCSCAIRDFFAKYFKCHAYHTAISILGWFVQLDGGTTFVETINGERIIVDTTKIQTLRVAMMQHILAIDQDATIIIEDFTGEE